MGFRVEDHSHCIYQISNFAYVTYIYIYEIYLVVRIHTYGIVYVHVADVRDFMDTLEIKVKPIVQRIDDVNLRIARSS